MPLLDDQSWENPLWTAFQNMRGRDPSQDTAPMPQMGDVPGDKLALKMSQWLLAANPVAALGRTAAMEGGKALWDVYGPGQQQMKNMARDYFFPPSYQATPLRGSVAPQEDPQQYGLLNQYALRR